VFINSGLLKFPISSAFDYIMRKSIYCIEPDVSKSLRMSFFTNYGTFKWF